MVWYEEENSLYLWLGATKESSKGIGKKLMDAILYNSNYQRQFVKTHYKNKIALGILEKYGFQEYAREDEVVLLERYE